MFNRRWLRQLRITIWCDFVKLIDTQVELKGKRWELTRGFPFVCKKWKTDWTCSMSDQSWPWNPHLLMNGNEIFHCDVSAQLDSENDRRRLFCVWVFSFQPLISLDFSLSRLSVLILLTGSLWCWRSRTLPVDTSRGDLSAWPSTICSKNPLASGPSPGRW